MVVLGSKPRRRSFQIGNRSEQTRSLRDPPMEPLLLFALLLPLLLVVVLGARPFDTAMGRSDKNRRKNQWGSAAAQRFPSESLIRKRERRRAAAKEKKIQQIAPALGTFSLRSLAETFREKVSHCLLPLRVENCPLSRRGCAVNRQTRASILTGAVRTVEWRPVCSTNKQMSVLFSLNRKKIQCSRIISTVSVIPDKIHALFQRVYQD